MYPQRAVASPVPAPARSVVAYTFGPYEADLLQCELRKFGIRIKLERKAWQLLLALLERPGQLITRAELEQRLWGDGVFVDFEHGLNVAVKKVRSALCDSAEVPQFIETIPGEGYRFMAPVERVESKQASEQPRELSSITLPVVVPNLHNQSQRSVARWRWVTVAVFAVLLATGFLAWTEFHHPAPLLHDSGWVLIADFENHTGEPVLDGTLEYALERELSNSEFVKVVPRERTGDVLQLMKKPLDSKIDRALGREVCLRDGEIEALITGRVEKLGKTYVLSVEIVNPATGITSASFSEEDQRDDQLAAAVRRLSGRVRKGLGENPHLVQQSLETLEKVTTPSLRALQLYSAAGTAMARAVDYRTLQGNPEAAELLELAVKEDPDFASAHLLLARAYLNLSQDEKARPHLDRAFQLADTVPEREGLLIVGNYYETNEEWGKAAQSFETLLRLYPDDSGGIGNLCVVYRLLGRFDQAAELQMRLAELRPHDSHLAVKTVNFLTNPLLWGPDERPVGDAYKRQLERAQSYAARVLGMLESQRETFSPTDITLLRFELARQQWLVSNIEQANSQFELSMRAHQPGDRVDHLLAGFAMSLGKLHEAQQIVTLMPWQNPPLQAGIAFYRGDLVETRRLLGKQSKDVTDWEAEVAVPLMIHIGMLREAESISKKLIAHSQHDRIANERGDLTVRGLLALAKGETAEGIQLLEPNLQHRPGATGTSLAYESLADAYLKQHKINDALRVLQEGTSYRGVPGNLSAAYRLRLRLKLADLYRELGRISDAEQVEAGLRKDLAFADPDHPILVALQHRQESNVSRAQTNTVASAATK